MILIVRGPVGSTGAPCWPPRDDDGFLRVDRVPDLRRSWNGVRTLLADVEARCGTARVERAIERHKGAASLVLDGLDADLSAGERAARDELGARLESHLSHNWALQRPLFDSWAAFLVTLLLDTDLGLFVSDLRRLDWETTAVLKSLVRLFPDRSPRLRFNYVPERSAPELDRHGILWRMQPDYIAETIMGFQIAPGSETRDASSSTAADAPATDPESPACRGGPAEHCLEDQAERALGKEADRLSAADCRVVIAAMEACFRRFGFTAALRLGLDLLHRNLELERCQAATVHGIVALCAHNRQFHAAGNRQLADFVERHLTAALQAEDRPELRCVLLYRLAVVLGRRKGNLEAALEHADRAVAQARQAGLPAPRAVYQEAWARNVRSYVFMRSRRIEDGARDLQTAFELLQPNGSAGTGDSRESRDLALTRALAAGNLAALANLAGDRPRARNWRSVAYGLEKSSPGIERYEEGHWIVLCREFHLPKPGRFHSRVGRTSARAENDAVWLHRLLLAGADFEDRIGRPHSAARLFRQAHHLRRRLGHPWLLGRAPLRAAAACGRAGRFAEARQFLLEALAEGGGGEVHADVHAAMAALGALAGSASTAAAASKSAVAAAEASGRQDVLLRVLATTGLAWQRLGQERQATESYERVLRLSAAESSRPIAPGDLMRALLGLHEIEGCGRETVGRCLKLVPGALNDPESWWDLERLVAALLAAVAGTGGLDGDCTEAMELLILAATQRRDCSAPIGRLCAMVPAVEELVARAISATAPPSQASAGRRTPTAEVGGRVEAGVSRNA